MGNVGFPWENAIDFWFSVLNMDFFRGKKIECEGFSCQCKRLKFPRETFELKVMSMGPY